MEERRQGSEGLLQFRSFCRVFFARLIVACFWTLNATALGVCASNIQACDFTFFSL